MYLRRPRREPAIRLVNGRNLGQNVTDRQRQRRLHPGRLQHGRDLAQRRAIQRENTDGSATPQATGYNRYVLGCHGRCGHDSLQQLGGCEFQPRRCASRTATPTTVNTAILAGDVASNLNGNATASGGAHNFPRFLENWNSVNFTYWGSLVEAYHSEEFTGLWQTGNVYYWPNRIWNFDTNFVNNRQPPGSPNGLQFSRGRWQRYRVRPRRGLGEVRPGCHLCARGS